ncbi:hypothetical protein ACFFWD_29930 [Bradyrhizobium erythrophlei]|uniref:hypothetical protein n=1 Tax=Bradyrhizobium erythrophlei TaxID=1437360 RepID=UPI0035E57D81
MVNAAADNVAVGSDDDSDPHGLIVSSFSTLVGHVQASLRLIESAIARETLLAEQETAANIFVLDDVTPRYIEASATLKACGADLRGALNRLLETGADTRAA